MKLLPPPPKEKFLSSKRSKYKLAALVDFILIILIIIFGRQPAERFLISPLSSSLHSVYNSVIHKTTAESFAFIPGLAQNKFSDIDLAGLTQLSFFDVPLTEEGGINFDSRGYASFNSDEALELFDRARFQHVKIFLTLSAWDKDIIENLLDSQDAQKKLAIEAIEEIKKSNIDGITIDFEYPGGGGSNYQQKFSQFITRFTNQLHISDSKIQVAVAIPSSLAKNQSIYHMESLSVGSDRIFLIASDFIVPEAKNSSPSNPIYGFSENDYWTRISNLLGDISKNIPSKKLVMERAWYGNGDNYPLYIPNSQIPQDEQEQASSVMLDQESVEKLISGVPEKGKDGARKSIPLIAKALEKEGILDSNVLAYALATIEHETDETFEPLEEIGGRVSARRLGYEGGMNYFGRGYIQLTHLRNYKMIGERIGMGDKLVKNPELAGTPEIAAAILAAFFKDNNVANLASEGNFIAARRPINPDLNGRSVARLAYKYEIN